MSETTPKVSVIIPTYNRAHFVCQAIESVLRQTFEDFELIVVDDGSTDNTDEVVAGFGDKRIARIYQSNQGVSAASNAGLEASHGEYVTFLGSDDAMLPQRLALHLDALEAGPDTGLVASGWIDVDSEGQVLGTCRPWEQSPFLNLETWLLGCPVGSAHFFLRKSWIDRVGGFDENLHAHVDWDLALRLSCAGCRMSWCRQVLTRTTRHPTSLHVDPVRSIPSRIRVLDKFYAQENLPRQVIELKDQAYSAMYLRNACRAYATSRWEEAVWNLDTALSLDSTLTSQGGKRLAEVIAGWALGELIENRKMFTQNVIDHLPQNLTSRRDLKRKALAEIAIIELFQSRSQGNWPRVRRAFLSAIVHDPTWFGNRGVVSIGIQALVGPYVFRVLKTMIARDHLQRKPH